MDWSQATFLIVAAVCLTFLICIGIVIHYIRKLTKKLLKPFTKKTNRKNKRK